MCHGARDISEPAVSGRIRGTIQLGDLVGSPFGILVKNNTAKVDGLPTSRDIQSKEADVAVDNPLAATPPVRSRRV